MPFAVAAAAATVYSANRGAKAQKASTAAAAQAAADQDAIARDQLTLSRDQFDWNRDIYERDIAPAEAANRELQARLSEDYLDTSKTQKDFAKEQRDEYKRTYLPIEQQNARDAVNYDSAGNVARRSGMAAANVNQQFSNSAGQKARLLTRFGMNPNSSTFARQAGADSRAQAVAASGAATGAAFDTEDKAIALRSGVANFGRNMPNTAASYFSGSNASNSGAGNASAAGLNGAMAAPGFLNNAAGNAINGMTTAGSGIGAAGRLGAAGFGNEAAQWGQVAQGLGSATGAAWNRAGGMGGIMSNLSGLFGGGGMDTTNYMPPGGYIGGGV